MGYSSGRLRATRLQGFILSAFLVCALKQSLFAKNCATADVKGTLFSYTSDETMRAVFLLALRGNGRILLSKEIFWNLLTYSFVERSSSFVNQKPFVIIK